MKKKAPAPKWTAKSRPVDETGRVLLRQIEDGGEQALSSALERLQFAGEDVRKKLSLVSLGAVEVLLFVRAFERDHGAAGSIARRLRRVLDGAAWNEAFDAPWAKKWQKVSEPVLRAFERNHAFEEELAKLRKVTPGATEEEAFERVAARIGEGSSTIRKARDMVRAMRSAIPSHEKK